jgi:hypothetical protein
MLRTERQIAERQIAERRIAGRRIAEQQHTAKRRHTVALIIRGAVVAAAVLAACGALAGLGRVGAATTWIGCPAETLTVRTGQRFYHTVVVSDILDLYAWQTDITYNATYLAYDGYVVGDFLSADGTAQHTLAPSITPGLVDDLTVTRLSRHTGQDGNGTLVYLFFTALKDTGSGRTAAKITGALLVDRNAIEIGKSYIDNGYCQTIIKDDAPVLVQPPIGPHVYLPMILR